MYITLQTEVDHGLEPGVDMCSKPVDLEKAYMCSPEIYPLCTVIYIFILVQDPITISFSITASGQSNRFSGRMKKVL